MRMSSSRRLPMLVASVLILIMAAVAAQRVAAQQATPAPTATPAAAKPAAVAATAAKDGAAEIAAFYGKKFSHAPVSTKLIALTFDDGPYAKTTPRVVEILKRENVTATFFMLGQAVRNAPEVAKLVAQSGFELGCHSMSHQNLARKGLDEIKTEVLGSADLVEQATGKRPHLFRPPYGSANAALYKVCADNGFVVVDWSVDPMDWKPRTTADMVYGTIMRQTRGGSVILMHDTKEKNLQALPKLIADLKAKGYQFTTISGLIAEAEKRKAEMPAMATGGEAGLGGGAGMDGQNLPPSQPMAIPLDQSGMQ